MIQLFIYPVVFFSLLLFSQLSSAQTEDLTEAREAVQNRVSRYIDSQLHYRVPNFYARTCDSSYENLILENNSKFFGLEALWNLTIFQAWTMNRDQMNYIPPLIELTPDLVEFRNQLNAEYIKLSESGRWIVRPANPQFFCVDTRRFRGSGRIVFSVEGYPYREYEEDRYDLSRLLRFRLRTRAQRMQELVDVFLPPHIFRAQERIDPRLQRIFDYEIQQREDPESRQPSLKYPEIPPIVRKSQKGFARATVGYNDRFDEVVTGNHDVYWQAFYRILLLELEEEGLESQTHDQELEALDKAIKKNLPYVRSSFVFAAAALVSPEGARIGLAGLRRRAMDLASGTGGFRDDMDNDWQIRLFRNRNVPIYLTLWLYEKDPVQKAIWKKRAIESLITYSNQLDCVLRNSDPSSRTEAPMCSGINPLDELFSPYPFATALVELLLEDLTLEPTQREKVLEVWKRLEGIGAFYLDNVRYRHGKAIAVERTLVMLGYQNLAGKGLTMATMFGKLAKEYGPQAGKIDRSKVGPKDPKSQEASSAQKEARKMFDLYNRRK